MDYIYLSKSDSRHISSQRFVGSILQCLLWSFCSAILQSPKQKNKTKQNPHIHIRNRKESFWSLLFIFISCLWHPKPTSHKIKSWSPTMPEFLVSPIVCSGDFKKLDNIRLKTLNNVFFFLLCLYVKVNKNIILKPSKYLTLFTFPLRSKLGKPQHPKSVLPAIPFGLLSSSFSCIHFTCLWTATKWNLLHYHIQTFTFLLKHRNDFLLHQFQIPLLSLEAHHNLSLLCYNTHTHTHTTVLISSWFYYTGQGVSFFFFSLFFKKAT